MAGPLPLRFVRSFADVDDLPRTEAELAVVGRSNVGKSSLVNALAHHKGLAKTSKTPGATRLINAFEIGPEGSRRWLTDLPGYGYAKVSKAEQRRWATMIDAYLRERDSLVGVVLLIDGMVGPTASDLDTLAWLHDLELPVSFVATKADRIRPSKSKKRRADLCAGLGVERGDVSWVSSEKGTGIPELRDRIRALVGLD